jgi:7-carboxy-7-deazaguanine synthase
MRIAEIFRSIQGEGLLAGVPSVFIRVAGCNRRCRWCDTPRARSPRAGREMALDEIVRRATAFGGRHVVLTGGEPMAARGIRALARRLSEAGRHVTIETNATIPPRSVACDLASLSPKLRHAGGPPPDLAVLRAWLRGYDAQLKFVVRSPRDAAEARALLDALGVDVPPERVFLMPEARDRRTLRTRAEAVRRACLETGYRFGPRLHVEWFDRRKER